MTENTEKSLFPQVLFMDIMRDVQDLFSSVIKRRQLLADINLPLEFEAQQSLHQETTPPAAELAGPQTRYNFIEQASNARFCRVMLDELSKQENLDRALSLAKLVSRELGSTRQDVSELISTLQSLYLESRKQALQKGDAPDLDTYQGWKGLKAIHFYSLTDRFMGRKEQIEEMDTWMTAGSKSEAVLCLCALGGSGKSALAWHWANHALGYIRQNGYRGVFWCSFYEKDFDFEDFMREALVFAGGVSHEVVNGYSRSKVEEQLHKVLDHESFLFVIDGLERLMNGYSVVFDRVIDPDTIKEAKQEKELTTHDRRMTDPRNGAFLRSLAKPLKSKLVMTTRLVPAELEDEDTKAVLDHVHAMHLKGFLSSETAELWQAIAPDINFNKDIQSVLTLSGNHALITSILARSVREANGWTEWLNLPDHKEFLEHMPQKEVHIRSYIIGMCMGNLGEPAYDILGVLTTSGKPMKEDVLKRILIRGSAAGGDDRWKTHEQVEHELEALIRLGFIGKATPDEQVEYDVHPVIRGTVWNLITDPGRKRFLSHAYGEFSATPDKKGPDGEFELNKAATLYQLLIHSGEIDRAWDMFYNKLWWPLAIKNDNRTLLRLFDLLLTDNDPLCLLPLRSRREQGNAADVLGNLLMSAGDFSRSGYLLQWCGAIRLQSQDLLRYLSTRHASIWQTLYQGHLFEAERMLYATRLECMYFGAVDIIPNVDCLIGIILALRGEAGKATEIFTQARSTLSSYRWGAQAEAECYIYLEMPGEAIKLIKKARQAPLEEEDSRIQVAWEDLTLGIALFQNGDHDKALDELAKALETAVRTNYVIITCFTLPYIAEIYLLDEKIEMAEQNLEEYFRYDPEGSYQLSASDAWRVKALCFLKKENKETALECAERAYRLAACDGPPFVYRKGLARAIETLEKCKAYVPPAKSRLDPLWKEVMDELAHPRQPDVSEIALRTQEEEREAESAEDIQKALAAWYLDSKNEGRVWWEGIFSNAPGHIEHVFKVLLMNQGVSLEYFHDAFEKSSHKSLEVVFHQINADRILFPDKPEKFGDLDEQAKKDWLKQIDAHQEALHLFLKSRFANMVAQPFVAHHFDSIGINVFLQDDKRRIGYGKNGFSTDWWDQMEEKNDPFHILILAECILSLGLNLDQFLDNTAVNNPRGIEYSFAASRIDRSIDRLNIKAVSNTESWDDLQIFLRLQDVKQLIKCEHAEKEAREFWLNLEKKSTKLNQVLKLAEELAIRQATIQSYYGAYLISNTDNVQANLAYVDYTRLNSSRWDVEKPWPYSVNTSDYVDPSQSVVFTDTKDWAESKIKNRLQLVKERITSKDSDSKALAWWEGLEKEYPLKTIFRLAEELDLRKSTISDYYLAHVNGDSDHLPSVLAYLDFQTFKRREESLSRSTANNLNSEGNAFYEKGLYRKAVDKYQAAITESDESQYYYTNMADAWERVTDIPPTEALGNAVLILEQALKRWPDDTGIKEKIRKVKNKKHLIDKGGYPATRVNQLLPVVTPTAMEYASDLHPFIEAMGLEGTRLELNEMRERIRQKTGVQTPGIRVRKNEVDLPDGTYILMLDEIPIVSGNIPLGKVMLKTEDFSIEDITNEYQITTDPADGSDAYWVADDIVPQLPVKVLTPSDVMARHLEGLLMKNLNKYFGHQELQNLLINAWSHAARKILDNDRLFPRFLRLLKALIDEGVSIFEFDALCEIFTLNAGEKKFDTLLEKVRMHPEIKDFLPSNETSAVLLKLGPNIEIALLQGLIEFGDEHLLALEPELIQEILSAIRIEYNYTVGSGQVLLIDNRAVRRYARKLVELEFPDLHAVGLWEINKSFDENSLTVVDLD